MNEPYSIRGSLCRVLLIGLGALLLALNGGCALIPLATLGTVLGIAGTAASTGPEVYELGKLDVALRADELDCRRAVRRAAGDLQLHIVFDGMEHACHPRKWEIVLEDDLKSKMKVTIERRAGMLCLCRVNVGIFGSEPTAKLVMHVIESHLPPPATMPSGVTADDSGT